LQNNVDVNIFKFTVFNVHVLVSRVKRLSVPMDDLHSKHLLYFVNVL